MITVVSAGYGAGAVWTDVTARVAGQYAAGRRRFLASNTEFGPDPFPGVRKALVVVVSDGAGHLVLTNHEGDTQGAIILPDAPAAVAPRRRGRRGAAAAPPTGWSGAADPEPMLGAVLPAASDRKRRLFAVACCRRVLGRLVDERLAGSGLEARYRDAVDAAERFADGRATEQERGTAFWGADDLAYCQIEVTGATRAEIRKAQFGGGPGWAARARAEAGEDAAAFEAEADLAAWLEADRGEDDDDEYLNDVFDPFRGVAGVDAAEIGETVPRQVLLLVRTHLGRDAEVAERAAQAGLVREVFGDPYPPPAFDPGWRTADATALAAGIEADRGYDRLPILADALQDAGCEDAAVLGHLRGPGPHAPGCWALDLVLGKA